MEKPPKSKCWTCIGNCNILTEIINVVEFCDVGCMVQSLTLNITMKIDQFDCYFELGACFKVDLSVHRMLRVLYPY